MSSYDVGDVALLKMSLRDPSTGDLADTTSVQVTILRPDGTTSTPTDATHDGTGLYSFNVAITQAGTWRYKFDATGPIQGDEAGAFIANDVWTVPVAWTPTMEQVAAYIPTRTHSALEVGSQDPLGTWTPDTTPTDQQALSLIASSTAIVSSRLGVVHATLTDAASAVAAVRAAGFIELSYPYSDGDLKTATMLLNEAKSMLDDLVIANNATGDGPIEPLPVFSFPDPSPNFDTWPVS